MAKLVDRRTAAAVRPAAVAEVAVAEPEEAEQVTLTQEQLRSQTWRLIQNVADALPDDVVRFARQALVAEDLDAALEAIVFASIQFRVPLSTVEYAVLAECMLAVDDDISILDHVSVGDTDRPVLFEFVAFPSADEGLDDELAVQPAVDEADLAVRQRLGDDAPAIGVWRAWRYPVTGSPWPQPTPVYLIEAEDEAAVLDLAAAFYDEPEAAWAGMPIVEIYATGIELPPLHRAIQFAGELVFASSDTPSFTFADVFDGEPDESGRPQDVVRVSEEEAARLVDYLLSGTPMLVADAEGQDVLDPSRGQCVPLHLRTDGTWVWSDASAYYLREHLIGPPAQFHAYLQTVPPVAARVDDVTLHQAVAWLQSS